MLSFSTLGSASHPSIDKIIAARDLASCPPDLTIEGELQFDAAFVPSVAASKAPGSAIEGDAACSSSRRSKRRILPTRSPSGLSATTSDPSCKAWPNPPTTSRGCTAEDVRDLIAVTVVQGASPLLSEGWFRCPRAVP